METYGLKGPYAHYLVVMTRYPQGITAAQLGQECGDLWPDDAPETIIGSGIGTHAGPGAVATAFIRK